MSLSGGTAVRNTCDWNKQDGVLVSSNGTAPTLIDNTCRDNGYQGIAFQRGADDSTALTVVLGFFAVECVGLVDTVLYRQCNHQCRHQWNTLVGRAEQQVEVDAGVFDGVGVKFGQRGEVGAAVENARVEEVGADAAGFQCEFAEAQRASFETIVDETGLIVVHALIVVIRL